MSKEEALALRGSDPDLVAPPDSAPEFSEGDGPEHRPVHGSVTLPPSADEDYFSTGAVWEADQGQPMSAEEALAMKGAGAINPDGIPPDSPPPYSERDEPFDPEERVYEATALLPPISRLGPDRDVEIDWDNLEDPDDEDDPGVLIRLPNGQITRVPVYARGWVVRDPRAMDTSRRLSRHEHEALRLCREVVWGDEWALTAPSHALTLGLLPGDGAQPSVATWGWCDTCRTRVLPEVEVVSRKERDDIDSPFVPDRGGVRYVATGGAFPLIFALSLLAGHVGAPGDQPLRAVATLLALTDPSPDLTRVLLDAGFTHVRNAPGLDWP